MSERSYIDFLEDIQNSIDVIENYIDDMNYEQFKSDRRTVDAVVRNFEIIGEAARNLPEDFKDRYDSVKWRGVVNFRNVMIHDYFRVNTGRVWDTIDKNLPQLKQQIDLIIKKETEGNN